MHSTSSASLPGLESRSRRLAAAPRTHGNSKDRQTGRSAASLPAQAVERLSHSMANREDCPGLRETGKSLDLRSPLSCCPGRARKKGVCIPGEKSASSAALPLTGPGLPGISLGGRGSCARRGCRGCPVAAVHAQDPAQLVMQHLLEAGWQGQALEGVP